MKNNFPEIIFEDANYLVINKPAGLIVHGGSGIKERVLTDLIIERYPQIKEVGEDDLRPGIVHRLDKEVSGVMVIAKTQEAFLSLKKQFKNRDIYKEYLALAHGKLPRDEGEINFPIKRAKDGYKMAAIPYNSQTLLKRETLKNRDTGNIIALEKARSAVTLFKVIKQFINFAYLSIRIKTGRTHQIRVHFHAYGHPLVGDNLYYTSKTKAKNAKIKLGRIFLVANNLSFKNLEGEILNFKIDLPVELAVKMPKN
jgi:23S rRNA pseudouridine1911/1915/1917 synthase